MIGKYLDVKPPMALSEIEFQDINITRGLSLNMID